MHTRVQEGNSEDTVLFVHVAGANINFDDNGRFHSILNTLTIRVIVDSLSAAQGLPCPRYIDGAETSLSELPLGARA